MLRLNVPYLRPADLDHAVRKLLHDYAAWKKTEVVPPIDVDDIVPDENDVRPSTAADIGLSRKDIHEARLVWRQQQARPRRASDRTGVAPRDGRRGGAGGARHTVPPQACSHGRGQAGLEPGCRPEHGSTGTGTGVIRTRKAGLDRSGLAQQLSAMTSDEWQAHVTREAAKAMGEWLEGRGRLHQPIAALTLADLEAMATNAISRFVVLGMDRIRDQPADAGALTRLLLA